MPIAPQFLLTLTAGPGLAFSFDCLGVPSLVPIATDVSLEETPQTFGLEVVTYPNPFNPSTAVRFVLPEPGEVELSVYDIRGRLVTTLVAERLEAGFHETVWRGRDSHGGTVSAGVYLCRLTVEGRVMTRKLTLLK
jgi:hypothetical protein